MGVVALEECAKPFLSMGYEEKKSYFFEAKKLRARHYEHKADPSIPKIFIRVIKLLIHFHHDQEFFKVNFTISVNIDTFDHGLNLIIGGVRSKFFEYLLQFIIGDTSYNQKWMKDRDRYSEAP